MDLVCKTTGRTQFKILYIFTYRIRLLWSFYQSIISFFTHTLQDEFPSYSAVLCVVYGSINKVCDWVNLLDINMLALHSAFITMHHCAKVQPDSAASTTADSQSYFATMKPTSGMPSNHSYSVNLAVWSATTQFRVFHDKSPAPNPA